MSVFMTVMNNQRKFTRENGVHPTHVYLTEKNRKALMKEIQDIVISYDGKETLGKKDTGWINGMKIIETTDASLDCQVIIKMEDE